MNAVNVGQVWKDKDKRRNTEILIEKVWANSVTATNVKTGIQKGYELDRLTKRWELVKDVEAFEWDGKGSVMILADHDHVHTEGYCIKNRYDVKCGIPTRSWPIKPKKLKAPEPVQKALTTALKSSKVTVTSTEKITRELWLEKAVDELRTEVFGEYEVPTVRVSVGWPGGRGPKSKTIGQCWKSETATDKVSQIFISPVLADPIAVLETLVHEIVHAIDDTESGHRGRFKSIAEAVGLEGKMTATHAGEALREKLTVVAESLGEYPHAAINLQDRPKVQKTYMLKLVSPEEPDFFVRMTQGKLDEYGAPRDPWGNEMELE